MEKKSNDLEGLKKHTVCQLFMVSQLFSDQPFATVKDWNEVREEAKKLFTHECICQLDASGFITTLDLSPVR